MSSRKWEFVDTIIEIQGDRWKMEKKKKKEVKTDRRNSVPQPLLNAKSNIPRGK